jgi:hypothetical protein
VSAVVCFFVC